MTSTDSPSRTVSIRLFAIHPSRWLALAAVVGALAGCRPQDLRGEQPAHNHYVLVHGSFVGGWGWEATAAELRARGEKVTTFDLPGHGADQTPFNQIHLQSYLMAVDQAVTAAGEPVILVGHSMGGMVITQYAENAPGKVKQLVYMAAYVIPNGKSLLDLAPTDTHSPGAPFLKIDPAAGTIDLPHQYQKQYLCADCTDAMMPAFYDHYRVDPLGPLGEKLTVTEANWGSVPKAYIFTENDMAVSPQFQHAMADATKLIDSAKLNTSHFPQISAPQLVAETLIRVSRH